MLTSGQLTDRLAANVLPETITAEADLAGSGVAATDIYTDAAATLAASGTVEAVGTSFVDSVSRLSESRLDTVRFNTASTDSDARLSTFQLDDVRIGIQETSVEPPTVGETTMAGASPMTSSGRVVEAASSTMIDDFEYDDHMTHYTEGGGGGGSVEYDITTTWSWSGTRGLEMSGNTTSAPEIGELHSDGSHPTYPTIGDIVAFNFNLDNGGATANPQEVRFWYRKAGTFNDGYQVRVVYNDSDQLSIWSSGSTRRDAEWNPGWENDHDYRVEIEWDDGSLGGSYGDHRVTVYDEDNDDAVKAQVSMSNTTYTTAGGIRWQNRIGANAHRVNVDSVRILNR